MRGGSRTRQNSSSWLASLGLEYRLFAVDDLPASTAALSDIDVLLNCAGPFMLTAEPLMKACIESGVHYLDIAAEPGQLSVGRDAGSGCNCGRGDAAPG
ncbi:saccharopine dehydrogenase NADP-binding domain-containing protein [Sphingomonas aurantiaca]|uniref:saccharopine dehydrogenase NADP-binding domain-containing protein n=1 Tax=Sphingomonas aurantiaca TaxID=185949 RepID=UPI002FE2703F